MKTQRLQAAFARKREAEHIRTEKTAAVDQYYSHWNQVTSKFQNWTGPKYYKEAEKRIQELKEKKEKEIQLGNRKEKLKKMFLCENLEFEQQLAILKKPRSRNVDADLMAKIDRDFKARQEERRRLEMEAKLYGRWRTGVNDENSLYESKSAHQALAKLNWLDKQIEDQMQREEEQRLTQERALRLQEEARKTEEQCKQRQEIRKKEIEEIRALQEYHMQELRLREQEVDDLKSDVNFLENSLGHLNSEIASLVEKKEFHSKDPFLSHNLRKIKVTIRKRSQEFLDELQSDIDLLNRLDMLYPEEKIITGLKAKLKDQRDAEKQNLRRIENMYESEAKANLYQCEETWSKLYQERHIELTNLLSDLKKVVSSKIIEYKQRQQELIDIRATHLSSIENSNERLKLLINEDNESPRPMITETRPSSQVKQQKPLQRISDSFSNLNLDSWSGSDAARNEPQTSRSILVDPHSAKRPSFGRKKVAWV